MNIIGLKIMGTFNAFLLTIPLEYLYIKLPSFITSCLSKTKDNLFEDSKVLFSSIIFSGVMQKITVCLCKESINNVCFSTFLSAIIGVITFYILYSPFYLLLGEKPIIKFIIMYISILLAEFVSYLIMNKKEFSLENKTIFFVVFTYLIFGFITYKLKN